jgi:hypothetical protein
MSDTTGAKLTEIMKFFGLTAAKFQREWSKLTDTDKAQIRQGIGNGTMTY